MKKIMALCICIGMLLLICALDARLRKQETVQTAVTGTEEMQKESERTEAAETEGTDTGTEAGSEARQEAEQPVQESASIRVLIKTDGYASEYHTGIAVASEAGIQISNGEERWEIPEGETFVCTPEEEAFTEEGILYLKGRNGNLRLPELARDRASDIYEGSLEIRKTDQGLLVINELDLEGYLRGVVSSEMPSSYPEEALKAQAVCARTYALRQKQEGRAAAYFADVDDSVSYQVYNNQDRTPQTDAAVNETAGLVLIQDGGLAEALYYSTSCGLNTSLDLSGESVFAAFLAENNVKAYESGEPWYRWRTEISLEALEGVRELKVTERTVKGAAQILLVTYRDGREEAIEGEYRIREFLAGAYPVVVLQDGTRVEAPELLPSAFLILEPVRAQEMVTGYEILGGGYGHGNGMSQNGAKAMALEGMTFREILEQYYDARVEPFQAGA